MQNDSSVHVPLLVEAPIPVVSQPATVGIPFPRGMLSDPSKLAIQNENGSSIPLQSKILARWPDQSVQWLLLEFVIRDLSSGEHAFVLHSLSTEPTTNELDLESCKAAFEKLSIQSTASEPLEEITHTDFYPSSLVRIRWTIRNPKAASHPGGTWDLGDPASQHLKECGLRIIADLDEKPEIDIQEQSLQIQSEAQSLILAVPRLRENGPGKLSVEKLDQSSGHEIRVNFVDEEMELQPGEQKTWEVWLSLKDVPLDFVQTPATVRTTPEWYRQCELFPQLPASDDERLFSLLQNVIEGERSFFEKRKIIGDGWRNYGEVYADHEEEFYDGPKPIISYYNNQYDVVYGLMLQYFRTGDARWRQLCDELARHVMDIDIYHTTEDKSAYNGGLFWHTDHYKDAATCTHRCYSKENAEPGQPYGGGPSNEHNYTTGLLHYFYLTGDPMAKDCVLSLAKWVINMDDGSKTIFGVVDDGPTGLASSTRHDYFHGPGRGAGNSINALLDAWLLTQECHYLKYAEGLIRRVAHPKDDIDTLDLLNLEDRWSYTVFLTTVARYLDLKPDHDFMFACARATLLHYAEWMAENERFYFDHPDQMEYPTETWAAQEIRKANVLRLAAQYADAPLRERLRQRGEEFSERCWQDLMRFESRTTTRPLAIFLVEGLRDLALRESPKAISVDIGEHDFGEPEVFVPQKQRVKSQIKSPLGAAKAGLRLINPARWIRYWRRNKS